MHELSPLNGFYSMGGIYTTLSSLVLIFFPFEVKKVVLPLGVYELHSVRT